MASGNSWSKNSWIRLSWLSFRGISSPTLRTMATWISAPFFRAWDRLLLDKVIALNRCMFSSMSLILYSVHIWSRSWLVVNWLPIWFWGWNLAAKGSQNHVVSSKHRDLERRVALEFIDSQFVGIHFPFWIVSCWPVCDMQHFCLAHLFPVDAVFLTKPLTNEVSNGTTVDQIRSLNPPNVPLKRSKFLGCCHIRFVSFIVMELQLLMPSSVFCVSCWVSLFVCVMSNNL